MFLFSASSVGQTVFCPQFISLRLSQPEYEAESYQQYDVKVKEYMNLQVNYPIRYRWVVRKYWEMLSFASRLCS